MVNGTTSRIIYVGAWLNVLACIVGIVILASGNHETPAELSAALTGSLGIIAGSHLKPPISAAPTRKLLEEREG